MPSVVEQAVEQPVDSCEEILHLVCHCQLDDDWNAATHPLVSYCGWVDDDVTDVDPQDLSLICTMCIEAPVCPVCGGPKPALA